MNQLLERGLASSLVGEVVGCVMGAVLTLVCRGRKRLCREQS